MGSDLPHRLIPNTRDFDADRWVPPMTLQYIGGTYIVALSMIQTEDAVRIGRAVPKPDEVRSIWNSGSVRSRPPWSTII
jgi:hypothetical protein